MIHLICTYLPVKLQVTRIYECDELLFFYFENLPKIIMKQHLNTSPWKTYLQGIYDYSKFTVGQVVPVNAFILAEDRASISDAKHFNGIQIFARLFNLITSAHVYGSDPFANRSAAGGVGYGQLPNGGDQGLYQDNLWGSQDTKTAIKIVAHEYFHVHQNGLELRPIMN